MGQFIEDSYAPEIKANRPHSANKTLQHLKSVFGSWYARPISVITDDEIEKWRIKRLNAGRAPTTALRDLSALSGVLSRAVKKKKIALNPTRLVEKPKIDRRPKARFLSADEEKNYVMRSLSVTHE